MSGVDEGAQLATPDFWDERYKAAEHDISTHEWLRSFDVLQPFFSKYLYESRGPEQNPRILHLGCGDSVCHLLEPPFGS